MSGPGKNTRHHEKSCGAARGLLCGGMSTGTAACVRRHLQLCGSFYGDGRGTNLFRKFSFWYSKGFLTVKSLRIRAFAACTCAEMPAIIDEMYLLGREAGMPKYDSQEAEVLDI